VCVSVKERERVSDREMVESVIGRVREWAQRVRLAFRSLQPSQLASALAIGIVFGLVPIPGAVLR
jgi:hypothetical protein